MVVAKLIMKNIEIFQPRQTCNTFACMKFAEKCATTGFMRRLTDKLGKQNQSNALGINIFVGKMADGHGQS